MPATKTHPACTIHEDGMQLPLWLDWQTILTPNWSTAWQGRDALKTFLSKYIPELHSTGHLKDRGVEKECCQLSTLRSRTICITPGQHGHCFHGNCRELSERGPFPVLQWRHVQNLETMCTKQHRRPPTLVFALLSFHTHRPNPEDHHLLLHQAHHHCH